MGGKPLGEVVRHLHQLAGRGDPAVADAVLLQRYVGQRDEAAFELLLRRHGPMVRGVCRRLLRDAHDAEDAFQATFLTLVRKAGGIRRRDHLAGWLYRVAQRTALRARADAARRPATNTAEAEPAAPEAASDLVWRDLRPVLDEEVDRLPARYRLPVILCYLQGLTNEQAARQLGCAKGTVAVRLMRARKRLHGRLTRRGLAVSAVALTATLTAQATPAALPAAAAQAALSAAMGFGTGSTAAASAGAVLLAKGVLRSMLLSKLKTTAAVLVLAAGIVGLGVGLFPRPAKVDAAVALPPKTPAPTVAAPQEERPADVVNIPSQRDGIVLVLGTEIKDGEKVPAEDVVTVKQDGKERRFRRLKVGDKVEEGQLIGLVDDSLAREEVKISKAKVVAAEADRVTSEKTCEEAKKRHDTLVKLFQSGKAVAEEEVRAAEFQVVKYRYEEIAKRAEVEAVQANLRRAELVLSLYEIRAVRGEVKAILKRRGEAVRAYETVVQIRTGPAAAPQEEQPADVVNISSDRDGQIVFLATELKPGEEKTLPPNRMVERRFLYLAVEVDYNPRTPALSYPLAGAPPGTAPFLVPASENGKSAFFNLPGDGGKKAYTRWKEGMPLYANHVRLRDEVRKFRLLEVGDPVAEGALLALIKPDLAEEELRNKCAKLVAAEADRVTSEKTCEEAKKRHDTLVKLFQSGGKAVAEEEMRAAELQAVKYRYEEIAKRAAVRQAETEVGAAMKLVTLHEVRGARGQIKAILRRPGEGVKANETVVLQIRTGGQSE